MHRHVELPQAFAALGIEAPILQALTAVGYKEPSPVQSELIPHILSGRDVLGQARTGTGKTAAFGLPILQRIDPAGHLQAIVMTPTRELAVQVLGELRRLGKNLNLHLVPVYGGTNIKQQVHQLGRKPHMIVGTPGRVIDMLDRGILNFDAVKFVVLDEVDRMLDIGFRDDIRNILGRIRHPHQTVFVSATLEDDVVRLSKTFMKDPVEINVSRDQITVDAIDQQYCVVRAEDKYNVLLRLLEREKPTLAIVFTRTKHGARKLAKRLHSDGHEAREIHGDLVQQKRERIMEKFRKHHIPLLVATDLAARGIDVHGITHIINFDLPEDIDIYVHRIGRTARMGATGKAISLVTPEQGDLLTQVEMLINKQLVRLKFDGQTLTDDPGVGLPKSTESSGDSRPTGDRRPAHASSQDAPKPAPAPEPAPAVTPPGRRLGGKYPASRRRGR